MHAKIIVCILSSLLLNLAVAVEIPDIEIQDDDTPGWYHSGNMNGVAVHHGPFGSWFDMYFDLIRSSYDMFAADKKFCFQGWMYQLDDQNTAINANSLDACFGGVSGKGNMAHIVTLDERSFMFRGQCSYTMAEYSGQEPPANIKITASFTPARGVGREHSGVVDSVTIHNHDAIIVIGSDGSVSVDGTKITSNYTTPDFSILYYTGFTSPLFMAIEGVTVQYDKEDALIICFADIYSGLLRGMLGNFNRDPIDDLKDANRVDQSNSPNGVCSFGSSWQVEPLSECGQCCPGDRCRPIASPLTNEKNSANTAVISVILTTFVMFIAAMV